MWRRVLLVALVSLLLSNVWFMPNSHAATTWTEIYRSTSSARDSTNTNMIYTSGYGYNGSAVTNFTNSGATWDRIRIRIQFTLTSNSTLYWSDVSFDKWSGATLADLQLPDHRNQLVLNRNITNLVVD